MTRRVGQSLVLETELPKKCASCGEVRELRPYGKGGASVCFPCAMSTPESTAEAVQRFVTRLDGKEPGGEA